EKFAQYCFDKGHIENFVHCLGFGDFSTISDQAYTQIAKLTHTNLLLTMFLSKRFAAGMLHQDTKANNITLIASVAGLIQTPKSAVYAASKARSEEHTSELQSRFDLVCRLLLETKKITTTEPTRLS